MDLIIFYSPDKACMTYYINNDQAGYKIEYPFAFVKNIYWKMEITRRQVAGGGTQSTSELFHGLLWIWWILPMR